MPAAESTAMARGTKMMSDTSFVTAMEKKKQLNTKNCTRRRADTAPENNRP